MFLGGLQQNYCIVPGEVPIKIEYKKSAVGHDVVKAWDRLRPFKNLRTDPNLWLPRVTGWIEDGLEVIASGSKSVIKKAGGIVGEIIDGILHVKYANFGGEVVCHSSKTTTIVGRFVDNIDGGGITVIKDSKLWKYGENPAGVNILNDPNWTWQINEQWLTSAANRGDVIRVVSNPLDNNNIWKKGIVGGEKTNFGLEVDVLENLGYTFDASKSEFTK